MNIVKFPLLNLELEISEVAINIFGLGINVDVEETNLSVGNIEVYTSNKGKNKTMTKKK